MSNSSEPQVPDGPYWVVIGTGVQVHQCTTLAGVARVLKALPVGAEGAVVQGARLQVTQGPHRYLRPPSGDPVPLFEAPIMGATEPANLLGPAPVDVSKDEFEGLLKDARSPAGLPVVRNGTNGPADFDASDESDDLDT